MTMSCNVARFSSAPSERSTFDIQYPGLRKASSLGYNLVCASRLNSEPPSIRKPPPLTILCRGFRLR
jgi:hypothetical protein